MEIGSDFPNWIQFCQWNQFQPHCICWHESAMVMKMRLWQKGAFDGYFHAMANANKLFFIFIFMFVITASEQCVFIRNNQRLLHARILHILNWIVIIVIISVMRIGLNSFRGYSCTELLLLEYVYSYFLRHPANWIIFVCDLGMWAHKFTHVRHHSYIIAFGILSKTLCAALNNMNFW